MAKQPSPQNEMTNVYLFIYLFIYFCKAETGTCITFLQEFQFADDSI
jgi:hypothetical protein